VPILLPSIECLFESEQLPELSIAPDKAANTDSQAENLILDTEAIINDLLSVSEKITVKPARVVRDRVIDKEYWIKTNVDDVFSYLQDKYPKVKTEEFMRKHFKGKRGGNLGNSFRVKKSINNH
jgi:hypothetical protein